MSSAVRSTELRRSGVYHSRVSRTVIRPVLARSRAPTNQTTATVSGGLGLGWLAGALSFAPVASAQEASGVDTAINAVVDVVKATGGIIKSGVDVLSAGVKVVQEGYEIAAPVVKSGIDVVAPVVSEAVKATADVAAPTLKAAVPTIQAGAEQIISTTGVDLKTVGATTTAVAKTAQEGVQAAAPVLSQVYDFLSEKDAVTLVEYGLAAVALFYLAPPVLGAVFGSFRGFAGEITAAQTLDTLATDGSSILIDIRTFREKEQSGIPDVPSAASGKVLEVEYAATEDKKLRGALKDPSYIEAQITALQIASLKRVSSSAKIILIDRYGPQAATIAKELSKKGFTKVFVVAGGFDGRNGWVQSKLQIKPFAGALIAGPSAINGVLRTVSTRPVSSKKALPAPK